LRYGLGNPVTGAGRLRARVLLVAALCLIGGLVASRVVTRPPSPTLIGPVFSPGAVVSGATLGQWSARHWQWTVSVPIGRNPGHDVTGASCGTGQDGPVFFLPSNFPPCAVPADRVVFVPVVAAECSTAEPPPFFGETEAELRACAKDEADRYAVLVVRLDGVLVPDIGAYRASSPPFRLTLPESNVLGGAPGTALAVADGYHLLLAPLTPGPHVIMVHVELADGTVLPDKVARLTVVENED
jgi:hypothetical protein